MSDVICLGQFTADVVVTPVEDWPEKGKAVFVDHIALQNGGCACNTAMALGKLGIRTAVIGKVGCDPFGDFLIRVMKDNTLDISGMVQDQAINTSTTAVMVHPDGERSFLHDSGGNAKLREEEINYELIQTARILHVAAAFLVPGLDGEPMAKVLAKARQMGITTMLDTAWDAKGRWLNLLEPCLYHLDYFIPSLGEAQMLSGKENISDVADFFANYGVANIILKLGAKGCYMKTTEAEYPVPAFPVKKVVSTLGAGDAFVAGFIAGIINGYDLKKACRLANAVGAACVSAEGYAGVKPMEEILREDLGET